MRKNLPPARCGGVRWEDQKLTVYPQLQSESEAILGNMISQKNRNKTTKNSKAPKAGKSMLCQTSGVTCHS